jgi:hypothetical protein
LLLNEWLWLATNSTSQTGWTLTLSALRELLSRRALRETSDDCTFPRVASHSTREFCAFAPWPRRSGECDAQNYDLRTRRQGLRSSRDPDVKRLDVRIFVEGTPANGFTYSVDSEVHHDAALDGVPEDLVAGLMETAERDFRRGLAQELVTSEKATDDDIEAEIDKFKP